jgi:hypothetical protein
VKEEKGAAEARKSDDLATEPPAKANSEEFGKKEEKKDDKKEEKKDDKKDEKKDKKEEKKEVKLQPW